MFYSLKCFIEFLERARVHKNFLTVKDTINVMRTTIPATKKDVANAKYIRNWSSIAKFVEMTTKYPAKYIEITKQAVEIIAAVVSTFNQRPRRVLMNLDL